MEGDTVSVLSSDRDSVEKNERVGVRQFAFMLATDNTLYLRADVDLAGDLSSDRDSVENNRKLMYLKLLLRELGKF